MQCRSIEKMKYAHACSTLQDTAPSPLSPLTERKKMGQGSLQPHHSIFIMKAMDESWILSSGGLKLSTKNECRTQSTQRHIHKPICIEKYTDIQAKTHHQGIEEQTHKHVEKPNRTNTQSNKHTHTPQTNTHTHTTNKQTNKQTNKPNKQTNKPTKPNKQTNKQNWNTNTRSTPTNHYIELKRTTNKQTSKQTNKQTNKRANKTKNTVKTNKQNQQKQPSKQKTTTRDKPKSTRSSTK